MHCLCLRAVIGGWFQPLHGVKFTLVVDWPFQFLQVDHNSLGDYLDLCELKETRFMSLIAYWRFKFQIINGEEFWRCFS